MKTCPVCNAVAFDDQATCFGCLHDFAKAELRAAATKGEAGPSSPPSPASFVLSLVPQRQSSGAFTWSCTVEPVK